MSAVAGRRVLITGASRGLGAVVAQYFSKMGAHLALVARSLEGLEQVRGTCEAPDRHVCIPTDLLALESIPEMLAKATDFLGQIDCVLHCAGGGLGLREPLISGGDLMTLLRLNVVAAVEINRIVAPLMQAGRGGNLVHVGSVAGTEAVASVGYNTAKAALSAYVRSAGNLLIQSDIVVTGIQPGGFMAPQNSWDRLQRSKPEVVTRFIEERLPRKRLADASEMIPLLAFLCSENAGMMAGCMVPIDAGEGKTYSA